MQVEISVMHEAQETEIAALLIEAFGQEEGARIVRLMEDLYSHPAGKAGTGLVAKVDEKIVGFIYLSISLLDTFSENIKVAQLAPLAVHPDYQKQGIGRELVDALVEESRTLKLPIVFLEGDPSYYSKLGFKAAKEFGMRKPSIRIPDVAFQCMLLDTYEDWMRGTLVYSEPFWTNDCVGLRDSGFIEWVQKEVSEGREL